MSGWKFWVIQMSATVCAFTGARITYWLVNR